MKLWEVFRYELALQGRRFLPWLSLVVMTGLIYQVATEAQFEQARDGGYFFNAPIVIATVTLFGSLMALLVSAPLAGDAAARDVQLRIHPLVYTTPVGKGAYLGGRFLAAFVVQALILLAVPLGLLLATLSPGLEPELLGPFRPGAYLGAYVLIALPNAFVAAAFGFSLAALTRRPMAAYLGSVLVFLAMMVSFAYVAHKLGHWGLGRLLDPLGFTLVRELSRSWTAAEKNTRLLGLEGALLANRLLWVGLSLVLLALTHLRFRFAHPHTEARRRGRRARAAARAQQAEAARTAPIAVPQVQRRFGAAARARQVGAVAWQGFRALVKGGGALALVGIPALLVLIAPEVISHMGVPFVPTTVQVLDFIGASGDLFWLLIPLFTVWCAGELVWREREAGLSEIADATPVPDWVPFLGKLGALVLMLFTLHALLLAASLLVQVNAGYTHFEPGLYLRILFGLQLADRLLFALLALTVHVLVDQKYVGHLVLVLTHGLRTFAASFGLEHHLLVYGASPGWSYSDLSGFGPSLGPWRWFTLYWAAWALLLAVAARLLWVRGREGGVRARLQGARARLSRPVLATAVLAAGLILGVGGFILYNTNVLNTFRTAADVRAQRAEYERRYARYAQVEQPQLTGTRLHLELYPQRGEATLQGTYQLVNRSPAPIDTLHLAPAPDVETRGVRFDRPATVQLSDDVLGHRIYALAQPLQPGESLQLHFEVRHAPRGFPNDGPDDAVVANGSYFVHSKLLPALGYQERRELSDAGERRQHGLPPRPAVRALDDSDEVKGSGPRVTFEAVVGTDEGQVAIAPGALRRAWTEGGRRYFHYVTDVPIRNDYAFYSAAYAVHEGRWNDVAIQVFHHPGHGRNAARMVKSIEASLGYLSAQYGPYPHRQLRFVEHPGFGVGLHSSPVNISFREGFSLLDAERDPHDIDFPFAVAAHEVSHQWFCGQVTPAWMEGAPVLCESVAWYSALSVVEKTYGPEHLGRLMDLMREAYLTPRSRAGVPLLRAVDWFLAYRKGPFAMFALREYVGEERVNAALRRMVERYGAGLPPLPTSLDLYRELQAVTPEAQRGLLHDLFEANTYWELQAKRAAAEPAGDGTWWVTLDVQARKETVDLDGRATEVPLDEFVEVGAYAAGKDGAQGKPLYLERHRVRSGAQQLRMRVRGEPASAGIDPRHLLIDVNPEDNVQDVSSPSGRGSG